MKVIKNNCGIYIISDVHNGKCYYGSSVNIRVRWLVHLRSLRKNVHENAYLQRSFNKYGESNFIFKIVEVCPKSKLLILEQKYIDKNKDGYNICRKACGGDNLTNNPNRDVIIEKMTKSMRKWISELSPSEIKKRFSRPLDKNPNWKGGSSWYYCDCGNEKAYGAKGCGDCRDRTGKNNPFYNKTHSNKTKKIISKTHKGRKPINIKPIQVDGIKYTSSYEASVKLKISPTTIRWRVISKNKKFKNYKYIKKIKQWQNKTKNKKQLLKESLIKKELNKKHLTRLKLTA
jgi:group I intron endonuclease